MLLFWPVTGFLMMQFHGADPALATRIQHLVSVVLMIDDEQQEAAAKAEAKDIFEKRGLPDIATVGDEAAYQFVFLTCSLDPPSFQKQVLRRALEDARRHEVPADAASYCAAYLRQEMVRARARKHPPANPALRAQIEDLMVSDQAVRKRDQSDMQKVLRTDRENRAALEEIFLKHGVPTYRMVGPQAASDFVTMIQHQSPEFRLRVLPKLKANVDAGQADPGSYATVFDRSQTDAGKKQMYGQNLICDGEHPVLHPGPIEDEQNVNERRAAIGLMRLDLYTRMAEALMPNFCRFSIDAK